MLRVAQIAAVGNHSPWFADICAEMSRRGFAVVAIIDSSRGNLSARLDQIGIRHHKLPMHLGGGFDRIRPLLYLLQLPMTIVRLARILRREKIDIAQSHTFVANLVARVACFLARVPHIATAAGPRHLEAPLTRTVDRLGWSLDAAIVGGCAYTSRLYQEAGARQVETIYYGPPSERFDPDTVDSAPFRRDLGVPDDIPLVGLVAHFYPPTRGPQTPLAARGIGLKGHDVFLAAARIVARRYPQVKFVLVGGGFNALGDEYRRSLIEACRADGFIDHVLFPGHRYDIAAVPRSLDVAVQCAFTEGLGGTIEALLMERPTVATNVGGMPESVIHEETGLLVPPGDPVALAAAIERLLGDRELARRLALEGRHRMLQRFTLTRTGTDLAELYDRVIRKRFSAAKNAPTPVS